MFESISPEMAGIKSEKILEFMQIIDEYAPCTHSVLMAKGDKIFYECYYKPFHKDTKHRMYSVTKSFVGVAIGVLIEEGKINLEDKLVDFFPQYCGGDESECLKDVSIKNLLTMSTAHAEHINWFKTGTGDRCKVYFDQVTYKVPGTMFSYDSPGTFMLGAIIEKITGKNFLEYLKERFLNSIGFSKDAYCLNVPGDYAFADSALICTPRDLLIFARFVMNKGVWEGRRYMREDYLTAATTKQVDNNILGLMNCDCFGYGYQIWIGRDESFFFNGMGGQFVVCVPKHDFIFVTTADNQGNPVAKQMVFYALHHIIIGNFSRHYEENKAAFSRLKQYTKTRELFFIKGEKESSYAGKIQGVTYEMDENPMGIMRIRFDFFHNAGSFTYTNATGEKKLVFGLGCNEFGKFPEEGYPDMTANVKAPGNMYDCACSAAWVEPQKLQLKIQIIDKYLGNATMTFGFRENKVTVCMVKNAEAFLEEYQGFAVGTAV